MKKLFLIKDNEESRWDRLQKRETFINAQFWPYKVEFDSIDSKGYFREGELNIHFGPFLYLPAKLGSISSSYRDLKYLYGANVVSFRLLRPVRLEFLKKKKLLN